MTSKSEDDPRHDPKFPRKDPPTPSIWDEDVDWEKVKKLSPQEKHRMFPNDFSPSGEPYGDF